MSILKQIKRGCGIDKMGHYLDFLINREEKTRKNRKQRG